MTLVLFLFTDENIFTVATPKKNPRNDRPYAHIKLTSHKKKDVATQNACAYNYVQSLTT